MKILLLNDNPVVNKLVTLSAQKTSDELEVVESIDSINEGSYDLLVVDDTLYESELFTRLQEKITFDKSLYICARDAVSADEFTRTIKKPFLPTDLVELFSTIGKEMSKVSEITELDEIEELNLEVNAKTSTEAEESLEANDLDLELEELALDDDALEEEISLDEVNAETFNKAEESLEVNELEEFSLEDLDLDLDDDLSELDNLGDLEELDELTLDESTEEVLEGVLDKDELQEVQDLLDSTELNEVNEETPNEVEEGSKEVNAETPNEAEDTTEENDLELEEDLDLAMDDLDLDDDDLEEELDLVTETEAKEKDLAMDDLDLEVNEETSTEAKNSPKEVNAKTSTEAEESLEENDLDLELEEFSLEDDADAKEEDLDLAMDDLDLEVNTETPDKAERSPKEVNIETSTEVEKSPKEDDLELEEFTLEEVNTETPDKAEISPKENELEEFTLEENNLELDLDEDLSLESEIEKAVGELSQEELDSEIDENTLLDIADIASLNSRDIKLAIGEEVSEETSIEAEDVPSEKELVELSLEEVNAETPNEAEKSPEVNELEIEADNEGVKALKKLLEALSNKDVAASMKGMKISINIELGDS